MNVLDAAHRIGHEYPGGTEALALRVGIRPAVLRAKLNPNADTNHLTIVESVRIQQIAGRKDILQAMALELNAAVIDLPAYEDKDVAGAILQTVAEFGAYMADIHAALDDNRITPNELKHLEQDLIKVIADASRLQSLLAGMSGPIPHNKKPIEVRVHK